MSYAYCTQCYFVMDSLLETDLDDVLEGCDPLESLLEDPELVRVAQEVYESNNSEDILNLGEGGEDETQDLTNCDSNSSNFLLDVGLEVLSKTYQAGLGCPDTSSSFSTSLSTSGTENAPVKFQKSPEKSNNHQCVACGNPAIGYLYFGVMACFGCKSFFARSIKNDLYKSYTCTESHDLKSWTKCRKCRFDKLIKVGMKIPRQSCNEEKVNDDDFSPPDDKGTIKQYVDRTRELLMSSTSMSMSEKLAVEEITSWHLKTSLCLVNKLIRRDMEFLRNILEFFYYGENFSAKNRTLAERYMIYGAQKSYVRNGCWVVRDDLSSKDRARLVRANFPLVYEYSEAFKIKSGVFWDVTGEVESYVDSLVFGLKDEEEKKNIVEMYLEVHLRTVSHRGTLKPIDTTYEIVYSLDQLDISSDEELSKRHRKLADKISRMTWDVFDPVMLMLNYCILLYNADGIELDDASEAERLQMMYASLLYRYLKDQKTDDSGFLFRESMLAISYARELREIRENSYKRQGLAGL